MARYFFLSAFLLFFSVGVIVCGISGEPSAAAQDPQLLEKPQRMFPIHGRIVPFNKARSR